MGTKHKVFDDSTKLFEAEAAGTFTVAAHDSAVFDLTAYADKSGIPRIWMDWPGLDSAGTATVQLKIYTGATSSPTTLLYTGRALTLAEAQALFDTNETFELPLPMSEMLRYGKLTVTIGTAVISAGALSAGISY